MLSHWGIYGGWLCIVSFYRQLEKVIDSSWCDVALHVYSLWTSLNNLFPSVHEGLLQQGSFIKKSSWK